MNDIIGFLIKRYYSDNTTEYYYNGFVGVRNDSLLPPTKKYLQYRNDNFIGNTLDSFISVHNGITIDVKIVPWNVSIIPVTDIPKDWWRYHLYGFSLNTNKDKELNINNNYEYAVKEVYHLRNQIEKLLNNNSFSTGE